MIESVTIYCANRHPMVIALYDASQPGWKLALMGMPSVLAAKRVSNFCAVCGSPAEQTKIEFRPTPARTWAEVPEIESHGVDTNNLSVLVVVKTSANGSQIHGLHIHPSPSSGNN